MPPPPATPSAPGAPGPRLARAVARAAPPAHAYRRAPAVVAVLAGAAGALVLFGWALDVPTVRLRVLDKPDMTPNTAVAVLGLAAALWLLRPRATPTVAAGEPDPSPPAARRAARLLAAAVLALAVAVGAEWSFDRPLGVDTLLFPDAVRRAAAAWGSAALPGRMGVNTVVTVAALAVGLLLMDARLPARGTLVGQLGRRLRGTGAAVGTFVPYMALVGYAYGVEGLYLSAGLLVGMSPVTALALSALGAGVTLARPERGLARLLTGEDAGALLLRRSLPVVVAVPFALGWALALGERRGLFAAREGAAGLVVALTLVMGHTLVRAAARARALDAERTASLAAAERQAAALTATARAREAAAQALAARDAEFRAMADNIPQLAWMADPTGWLSWYNERWYAYTGTTFETMQGWGWQAVHHPEHVERVTARFRTAIAAGTPWEDTFPLRRHDGAWRWFLSRANPIRDANGRVVRWFGTNTDVTEQREARAEAEAASRAKSQFLATMSHELRTPLNAIGGHVQLVEMGIHGPVTPAQAAALERVGRAQRHLLGLINDVLNLSRIEAGRVEYQIAEVAAADLVADVTALVESQLANKDLAFSVELPPDPHALVARADREKAGQVLLNLLSNAAKFTPSGGRVSVEGVAAEGAEGLPVVELLVRDTGVGIPADQLGRIFEPFVQVDGGLTRAAEGTGLGLAISRDLARGMGGDLLVRSEEGRGSVFTLVLPRVPPADGDDRRTGEERRDGDRREIGDRRDGDDRRHEGGHDGAHDGAPNGSTGVTPNGSLNTRRVA